MAYLHGRLREADGGGIAGSCRAAALLKFIWAAGPSDSKQWQNPCIAVLPHVPRW